METDELDFNKIKDKVATYALQPDSKAIIINEEINSNFNQVKGKLNETQEVVNILDKGLHIPFIDSNSLSFLIRKVEKGLILKASELEKIADFIRTIELLQRFFYKNKTSAPVINSYTDKLILQTELQDEIYQNVEHGTVSDKSNSDLARLRREYVDLKQEIQNGLNKYLQSKTIAKYLQTNLIVQKNGHYTIPIKKSYKNQLAGTIIETSNNGQTVYIEPRKIKHLVEKQTTIEAQIFNIEQQVLGLLSAKIYGERSEIKNNLTIIIDLDIIFAKAKYSYSIGGIQPHLNQKNIIELKAMKHPLLLDPVPLTISLAQKSLVITGPNAGGKTISLKTIGLAIKMTQFGLFLPSEKACNIPIMDQVFTSIGDHQDLDNSLSTFSAEMKILARIVNSAKSHSLILLDELGSGTDPTEGSALAIAILQELQLKGCLIIITTHYSSIKDFAVKHANFLTASMDFDLKKLTPTYQLLMNQVGESRAFWIAKQSGMNQNVLKMAKNIFNTGKLPTETTSISFKDNKISQHHRLKLDKGDIVFVGNLNKEAIFYKNADIVNHIVVFVDKEFITVPIKRVKVRRRAKDLYPEGYNLDLLFIKDWKKYKFNKDLDRGSKKAYKNL